MQDLEGLTKELREGVESLQTQWADILELLKQLQQEYEKQAKEFKL